MNGIDYMNNPRMEDLKDAPLPVRETYACRLAVQDRKRGMTPDQIDTYCEESRREVDAVYDKLGIRLNYIEASVMA